MSTVKLDALYSHSKNVGNTNERVGEFCGSPIVTLNQRAIDIDNLVEIARTVEVNKSFKSEPIVASILPGEMVCPDGVIRRDTSAEALGEKFYTFELPKDATKVGIEGARLASLAGKVVSWRPDHNVIEEFALIHEEVAA